MSIQKDHIDECCNVIHQCPTSPARGDLYQAEKDLNKKKYKLQGRALRLMLLTKAFIFNRIAVTC